MEWVLESYYYSRGIIFQNLRFKGGMGMSLIAKCILAAFLGCWVWCLYHSRGISEHSEPRYRDEETSSIRICTLFWWSLWQGYRALSARKHQGKQKPLMSCANKKTQSIFLWQSSLKDNVKENIFQAENHLFFLMWKERFFFLKDHFFHCWNSFSEL